MSRSLAIAAGLEASPLENKKSQRDKVRCGTVKIPQRRRVIKIILEIRNLYFTSKGLLQKLERKRLVAGGELTHAKAGRISTTSPIS